MSDTPEALVKSTHQIDGIISNQEKYFMTVEAAMEYAETLKCVSVTVLQRQKGVVLYQNPNVQEFT